MAPEIDRMSHSPPASAVHCETGTANKVLRRACDCCRKRKVRCDGGDPCGPCKKATIRCAYLQPPKKKGPKGLRSAKVLQVLRGMDDGASGSPTSPTTPREPFGNWSWHQQTQSQQGVDYASRAAQPPTGTFYGPPTSLAPDQSYCQQAPTSLLPLQQHPLEPSSYTSDTQSWTSPLVSTPGSSDINSIRSPVTSEGFQYARIPSEAFIPYVRLFIDHMFPIMPVIDHNIYLDPSFYASSNLWSSDVYCFLCALCAATVVQLDDAIQQPPPLNPTNPTDHVFADECLRERHTFDYIEHPSTLTVMTSFFLFAFSGNHEHHAKAWHYLQESITFAETLAMDDEASYARLDPADAQWRRRLYWLLFITERAYAVQRRKQTRLAPTVHLPAVFTTEDPALLHGFVNLARLFAAVDDNFVRAWRGARRASLCSAAWLAETQAQLDVAAAGLADGEGMCVSETQRVDVSVTREWLHVLAWQMGVSNGLIWGKGEEGGMRLDYPVELAGKVVKIVQGADARALDSHGIGMEQKLSDIAGCLADVLRCTAGDTSPAFVQGKRYLQVLLQQLSSMRGKESRYLQPLLAKTEGLFGYEGDDAALGAPSSSAAGMPPVVAVSYDGFLLRPTASGSVGRLSMADSVGMLRTLSMSGGALGMPWLAEWRREGQASVGRAEQERRGQEGLSMVGWTPIRGEEEGEKVLLD